MNQRERLRQKAARLSRPRPVELPSGKWRCQVMVGGERVSVVDDDPEAAHAMALALKKEIVQKEKTGRTCLALRDAIDQYVGRKDNALSPSTVRGYDAIKRNRFRGLMDRNVYAITKADVQAAVNKETTLVSPKTVYNAYGLIRPVLKEFGVDVFGVKLPQRVRPRKRYLQPEDVGQLIQAAQGDDCEAAILIAVWLGLRRSEIIGLCWDCIDFERNTITIRRTMVPDKDNKWVFKGGAKNEKSQRTISCPQYIMDKLAQIRPDPAEGQVFHIHPDTLRRHTHKICLRAGITDTTVHGLRHTNAAIMKSLGVDDAHAMQRGGWSSESTYKQTYSYVFDQTASDDDRAIDEFFENLHTNLHTEK